MKTLKIFVALVLVFGFALNTAKAQQKETIASDYHWDYYVECTGEWVCGTLTYYQTYWLNKNQIQFRWKGTMVGLTSGNVYEVSSVQNYHGNYNKGENYTSMVNFVMTLDGEVVAAHKVTFHYTVNANGEITAWVDLDKWWECD